MAQSLLPVPGYLPARSRLDTEYEPIMQKDSAPDGGRAGRGGRGGPDGGPARILAAPLPAIDVR